MEIDAAQRAHLQRYLDEIYRWNVRINLTTVPIEAAWERHIEESLRLIEVASLAAGARVADLGSGAGLPGIVLALVRPDLSVSLIEADRRKAGFLTHVAGLLGLEGATVVARRAETLASDPEHAGVYDVILSRAAAPPPRLGALALPLLRPGGELYALVGDAGEAAGLPGAEAVAPGVLRLVKR